MTLSTVWSALGRWWRRWRTTLILSVLALLVGGPGLVVGSSALVLVWQGVGARQAVAAHNIAAVHRDLSGVVPALSALNLGLHGLFWLSDAPGIGPTYRATVDLTQFSISAAQVARSATGVLPSSLPASTSTLGTVSTLVSRLPQLTASLAADQPQLHTMAAMLRRVPQHGVWSPLSRPLAAWTPRLLAGMKDLEQILPTWRRALPAVMRALGFPHTQHYLVFFQNNGEMRATGGFLTAYAVVTVSHGVVAPIHEHGIYSLASAIRYRPPAPGPIAYEFALKHWHLRDANTSPDVPTTVQTIYKFWNSIPHHPQINGVLFVDVWVADQLIGDVGRINLVTPYHHAVFTAKNANVTMEYLAELAPYPRPGLRKQFLGVLAHDLVARIAQGSTHLKLQVLQSLKTALARKWILLYFNNPLEEQWVSHFGWGGQVIRHTHGANYLQVVDENLGGHKDNFFLQEHVTTQIEQAAPHEYIQVTTVTLVNPALYNGWLVVPYSGLVRLYVPRGAELVSLQGSAGFSQNHVNPTLNKSVFGGFIVMGARRSLKDPPATGSLTVAYRLPFQTLPRRLILQEQPGSRAVPVTISIGAFHRRVILRQDTTVSLPAGLSVPAYQPPS